MCHLPPRPKIRTGRHDLSRKKGKKYYGIFLNIRIYLYKLTHEVLWRRSFLL